MEMAILILGMSWIQIRHFPMVVMMTETVMQMIFLVGMCQVYPEEMITIQIPVRQAILTIGRTELMLPVF